MAARTASPDTIQAALASNADGTLEPTGHAAYPKARSEPKSISRDDVLRLMKSDTALGEDFVLIDLRREDFEESRSYSQARRDCRLGFCI